MSNNLIMFPMFGMFSLTLLVLILLFRARLGAVRRGDINPVHFLTYSSGQIESRRTQAMSRQFSNLFEAPVLFYVVCLAIMIAGVTSGVMLGFAWGYVAMRALHTFIHIGTNDLRWRIFAYFGSWVFLTALWIGLLLENVKA